jgi:hypothetical protein
MTDEEYKEWKADPVGYARRKANHMFLVEFLIPGALGAVILAVGLVIIKIFK